MRYGLFAGVLLMTACGAEDVELCLPEGEVEVRATGVIGQTIGDNDPACPDNVIGMNWTFGDVGVSDGVRFVGRNRDLTVYAPHESCGLVVSDTLAGQIDGEPVEYHFTGIIQSDGSSSGSWEITWDTDDRFCLHDLLDVRVTIETVP